MTNDHQAAERAQLQQAITHLEQQRLTLGDDVVEATLEPLQKRLQQLLQQRPESDPSGQRRVVTVLFCDVVGSTKLAEGMDPEAWTEIMNGAFEYLIEPVKRYDGTVARLMGDAILAFFGAPVAHEDDPDGNRPLSWGSPTSPAGRFHPGIHRRIVRFGDGPKAAERKRRLQGIAKRNCMILSGMICKRG